MVMANYNFLCCFTASCQYLGKTHNTIIFFPGIKGCEQKIPLETKSNFTHLDFVLLPKGLQKSGKEINNLLKQLKYKKKQTKQLAVTEPKEEILVNYEPYHYRKRKDVLYIRRGDNSIYFSAGGRLFQDMGAHIHNFLIGAKEMDYQKGVIHTHLDMFLSNRERQQNDFSVDCYGL